VSDVTIACGLSQDDGDALAAALGGPVTLVPDTTTARRAIRSIPGRTLVVLGADVPSAHVLRFAAEVRVERPETVVVLLRPSVNRLDRELAGRVGIDTILPSRDLVTTGHACRDLLTGRPAAGQGRVVTVFAAKGGCGKTTIAINLAVALAEQPGRRVCLVDLDLRFGDLAVTLGLTPERTIASGHAVPEIVTPFRPGLDCVLAPIRPGEAERLELSGVGPALDALTDRYDVVVVDSPATFTLPVVSALDRSEHHVLVTTPERPALQSLRRTLDTLDLLGHRRDSRSVVFNRSDSKVGITAGDVEATLHAPIAAHVPSSRDVPTSVNRCLPLMLASPEHPVSAAIRQFALARLPSPAAAPSRPGAR
jgi:pilus assembly protein CpaE